MEKRIGCPICDSRAIELPVRPDLPYKSILCASCEGYMINKSTLAEIKGLPRSERLVLLRRAKRMGSQYSVPVVGQLPF